MSDDYVSTSNLYDIEDSSSYLGDLSQYETLSEDDIKGLLSYDYTPGGGGKAALGGAGIGTAAAAVLGTVAITNFWNPAGWTAAIVLGVGALAGAAGGLLSMGSGLSKDARGQILTAWTTAQTNLQTAMLQARATLGAAEMEAKAACNTAILDAECRMKESDDNLEAVKLQTEAQMYESDNVLEAALAESEVEADKVEMYYAPMGQAAIVSAEGEAERDEAEGQAELQEAENEQYEHDYDYLN